MQGQALSLGEIMYPEHRNTDGFFETESIHFTNLPSFLWVTWEGRLQFYFYLCCLTLFTWVNSASSQTISPSYTEHRLGAQWDSLSCIWNTENGCWVCQMQGTSWMVLRVGIQGWSEKVYWKGESWACFGSWFKISFMGTGTSGDLVPGISVPT